MILSPGAIAGAPLHPSPPSLLIPTRSAPLRAVLRPTLNALRSTLNAQRAEQTKIKFRIVVFFPLQFCSDKKNTKLFFVSFADRRPQKIFLVGPEMVPGRQNFSLAECKILGISLFSGFGSDWFYFSYQNQLVVWSRFFLSTQSSNTSWRIWVAE